MNDDAPPRSDFVSILAITFIVLSSGMTLVSILQNVMLSIAFPPEAFSAQAMPPELPAPFAFVFSHLHLFFLAFLGLSLFMLASSIGLWKRWAWARIAFIALMLFGIAWSLFGVALQDMMMRSMLARMPAAGSATPDLATTFVVMRVFGIGVALVFSALYGWIAWKLTRPEIAAEFS